MGVPKFFRYISERYPCLSELINADQVSDFDNLYLDMNGIIHMCSHPDDTNAHFRITEEKIFTEVFHYIAYLFQLISPKKVFFMAVDGVAPRAKMNQQRGRRFRTAREVQLQEEKARENGEKLPEEKRFDSNCITPGTVFMARLQEQLRYFVKQKISTDSAWAKCRVVLSGHETPGEGEHKIMEYIRFLKAQPDHDPNTRHCLYGLDADLIMLGLCSHEPNFSLLREEVKFGKNVQRASTPDENNFFLLHLSLLRDYLEQEFLALKDDLAFGFDMEKVVDDWVLMGFLVGNDFIPPLPHLHIHNDALPLLFDIYKSVIKKLDGYINEGGILNLKRFEVFMKELSKLDKQNFQETFADLKYFEGKTGRRPNANERKSYKYVPDNNETFGGNIEDIKVEVTKPMSAFQFDLKALIDSTNELIMDQDPDDEKEWDDFPTDEETQDSSDENESSLFNAEFTLHKRDYYINKLDYENVTDDILRSQAECYVRAVQWVLHYYYQGCASWSWFYPHHYAPYISDVVNFKDMNLNFDMGTPFKPFEQLLAVLPAASKDLLPKPFHYLMMDDDSPIQSYYPLDFKTDLNGKKNDWEAVVLIPFIDEVDLLKAMQPFYEQLTEDETKRNTHGPMHIYDYTPQDLGECRAPEYFPLVRSCHARETPVWLRDLAIPPEKVVRGPLPNPHRGLLYPGIPTLRHLMFKSHFTSARVKVFDYPSRNDNCILRITHDSSKEPAIETVAANLLGKVVWAGWPHLAQAKVVEVSSEDVRYKYTAASKEHSFIEDDVVTSIFVDNNAKNKQWDMQKRTILDHNMNRLGIDVGEVTIIVHATSLKGYHYIFGPNGKLVTGAEWCSVSSPYPLQTVLHKLDTAAVHTTRNMSIQDALPKGDKVFIKTGPHYGCIAEIVDSSSVTKLGRVKICVFMEPEPVVQPPKWASPPTQYVSPAAAAAKCGVSPFLLSRITGCIFVSTSDNPDSGRGHRINIGLNIKFSKKNEEVTGYTRRVDNRWLYSQKCIELLNAYADKFHDMFQRLALKIDQDNFTERDLFPNNVGEGKLKEVSEWLKVQPYNSCSVRSCDSLGLEPEQIAYIRDSIISQQTQMEGERKRLALQVKPHVLFKPELHLGTIPPDPTVAYFRLYDRVINVNPRSTVPLGLKGTVIAISQLQPRADTIKLSEKLNTEPIYQILFDKPFLGGIKSDGIVENRVFKMQGFNLMNITQGRSLHNKVNDKVQINLKSSPVNNPTDTFKILRHNDGHNSAFANYASPTKNHAMPNDPGTSFSHQLCQPPLQYPSPKMQTTVDDSCTQLLKSLLRISETKNTVVQHQPPPALDNFFQPSFIASKAPNNNKAPTQNKTSLTEDQNFLQMVYPNSINNLNIIPPMPADLPEFNKGNMQRDSESASGPIQSQQFYNSNTRAPPNNLQLPFPQKLIEQDNMHNTDNQNINLSNGALQKFPNLIMSTPFIPLQAVTRQRNNAPLGNKNYKKGFHETKMVPSAGETEPKREMKSSVIPAVCQENNLDNRVKPAPKKKKSRIAANFGLID